MFRGFQSIQPFEPNFSAALIRGKDVFGDALFKRTVALLGEQGVIDLCAVSGYYTLVSMVLNVAEVPLAPGEKSPW